MDKKDVMIDKVETIMSDRADTHTKKMNDFFKTINKDSKELQASVTQLTTWIEKINHSTDNFNR